MNIRMNKFLRQHSQDLNDHPDPGPQLWLGPPSPWPLVTATVVGIGLAGVLAAIVITQWL